MTGNYNPYIDSRKSDKGFVRVFSENVDVSKLVWHMDHDDRKVTVLSGSGWKLQLDNQFPVELQKNCTYFIPKNTFHRIIRGVGDLKIDIDNIDYI